MIMTYEREYSFPSEKISAKSGDLDVIYEKTSDNYIFSIADIGSFTNGGIVNVTVTASDKPETEVMGYTSISRRWVYPDQLIGNFPSIDDSTPLGTSLQQATPTFLVGLYILCVPQKRTVSKVQMTRMIKNTKGLPTLKKAPPITSFT